MIYQCKYYISTPQDENGNLLPDKPISNLDVFVAVSEYQTHTWKRVEIYNIMEGHSDADIDYVEACKEITLDEYKRLTKGWFTPNEYLGGNDSE